MPPQLAFLDINELCTTVPFTIPKQTKDEVDQIAPGNTFPAPRSKTKVVSNFLLVLPPPWAPFFLCNEGLTMPAKDAALFLIRLASVLPDSTAQAIVTNFAWGLVTRRTLKATHPALAITIKFPRMNKELAQWRNQRLMGIFESVDLSSDTDQPQERAPLYRQETCHGSTAAAKAAASDPKVQPCRAHFHERCSGLRATP
jgi:hypothetical protein